MIPAKQAATTTIKAGEFEAAEGVAKAAAKAPVATATKGATVQGTTAAKAGTKTATKIVAKAGEFEAAEGAAKVAKAKIMTGNATIVKGTTAGKTTLIGKNVALTGKPAAKGILTAATKSATTAAGVGVSASTWGPVLLAGILIASGTGIYLYLKKRGMMGELEEVST